MGKGTWFCGLTLLQAKLKDFLHKGRSKFGTGCGYAFNFATSKTEGTLSLARGEVYLVNVVPLRSLSEGEVNLRSLVVLSLFS